MVLLSTDDNDKTKDDGGLKKKQDQESVLANKDRRVATPAHH
jgi:hypothetical protein